MNNTNYKVEPVDGSLQVFHIETGYTMKYDRQRGKSEKLWNELPTQVKYHFEDWVFGMSNTERDAVRRMYMTSPTEGVATVNFDTYQQLILGSFSTPASPTTLADNKNKKKEHTMCYDCDCDYDRPKTEVEVTEQKRRNLLDRLHTSHYMKIDALREKFNLNDMEKPQDGAELVKRIKDGLFELDEDEIALQKKNQFWFSSAFTGLRWRDPAKKADLAGFDAAVKDLDARYETAQLTISIKSLDDGLAAYEAFKAS